MSDFVKPNRIEIDVAEEINVLFGTKLIKDLHENEAICPVCKGTGIRVEQNRYGLSDDPDKDSGHFPYLHQSFSFCHNCYNGIVRYCADCGKQLCKGRTKCDCEAVKKREAETKIEKELRDFEKATKHEASALGFEFVMCYSEYCNANEGYFQDWEKFFENLDENLNCSSNRPKFVWGTEEVEMELDAYNIISSACEDMFEDAISNFGNKAISEMQAYLNEWKNKYGVCTYFQDNRHAVKIPWELYKSK